MNPLVSISCITYNQKNFIRDCLDGFLSQKTNFNFEIIIHDDASTDGTKEIIQEYQIKYPDLIFPLFQKTNQYSQGVRGIMARFNFPRCKGKYIAMCEGDDYWTDEFKLQKQIDFLENNLDFVLTFHPVNVQFSDGSFKEDFGLGNLFQKSESTIYDLAVFGNYIHTPSVVFRNVITKFPNQIFKSPIGDYFLWILIAQYGRIKKLSDNMAVYRFGVGIFSSDSDEKRERLFLKTLLLLSESVDNITIKEILKNRVLAMKTSRLPYPIRRLEDYSNCAKLEIVADYVSIDVVFRVMILKILRYFKNIH